MTDAEYVREIAQPLVGEARDYDALLQLIGDARFVLIGEASHGTHEFYFERAAITKRLIAEKGFSIVQSRRIGRTQLAFIVTCAVLIWMPIRIKRFRAFAGFQRGCG